MIIDVNAFIGHYPFRRMAARHARDLVALMDDAGIQIAVASSLNSVFYRDSHRGNEDMYLDCQSNVDRFCCVATVNPTYAGWQRDMDEAINQWQMKAVALWPEHHGYKLSDPVAQAVIERLVKRDLPLVLTQRLEDRRQRHAWDVAEDLILADVLEVAKAYPGLRIHFSNWIGLDGRKLLDAGLKDRCLIDFARLHVLLHGDVGQLIERLGVSAMAFGSHMPFDYAGPSLVKLSNLDGLSPDEKDRVRWRNAADFFKIKIAPAS